MYPESITDDLDRGEQSYLLREIVDLPEIPRRDGKKIEQPGAHPVGNLWGARCPAGNAQHPVRPYHDAPSNQAILCRAQR